MTEKNTPSSLVTLRIASKTLNSNYISNVIGVNATEFHDIGDLLSLKSPTPCFRKESLWLLQSNIPEEHPLEVHIESLLLFIETKKNEIKKLSTECDIEIFCCFSSYNGQGSFVLNHILLEKIGKLPIDFIFDLYLL